MQAFLRTTGMPGAYKDHRKELDPLGLELQMVVNHYRSAGNGTQVLCDALNHWTISPALFLFMVVKRHTAFSAKYVMIFQ